MFHHSVPERGMKLLEKPQPLHRGKAKRTAGPWPMTHNGCWSLTTGFLVSKLHQRSGFPVCIYIYIYLFIYLFILIFIFICVYIYI